MYSEQHLGAWIRPREASAAAVSKLKRKQTDGAAVEAVVSAAIA